MAAQQELAHDMFSRQMGSDDQVKALEQVKESMKGEKKAEVLACVVRAYDVSEAIVTYTVACRGTLIESRQTYHGDSSEGVLKSTRDGKKATTAVKGRRLGACHS